MSEALGRYILGDADENAIEALPARIDCLTLEDDGAATKIADCWNRAIGEGAIRRATRRALKFLQEQARAASRAGTGTATLPLDTVREGDTASAHSSVH